MVTINNLHTAGMRYVLADLVCGMDRTRFVPIVGVGKKYESHLEKKVEVHSRVIEIPYRIKRRPIHTFVLRMLTYLKQVHGKIDLIHSFDYSSDWSEGLATKLLAIPWIVEKTNLNYGGRNWWLKCLFATRIICLSECQVNALPVWRRKCRVIPTGIDLEGFKAAKPLSRHSLGLTQSDVVLACVAQMVRVKGHIELIRALGAVSDELKQLKVVLAGSGGPEYVKELQDMVVEYGLENRVLFLGHIESVQALLKMCDGKILPTRNIGRREAFGAALAEAMAAGLPVIATKSGGPEEIVVHGETGWLVDAVGYEALIPALQEFYKDREKRESYGMAGQKRAEKLFNREVMIKRYEGLYENVLYGK